MRAAQLHRLVEATDAERGVPRLSLREVLDRQPLAGSYELSVRATQKHSTRIARLQVRFARVTICRPKRRTNDQRALGFEERTQSVVEVREVRPPPRRSTAARCFVENSVLWTSLPVANFDEAWQIIEDYERRWLIEEDHKAIKTGCRLEVRQYLEAHRLEAVAGFTCMLAMRLLQLKTVVITHPDLPAEHVVPKLWLEMLGALRKRKLTTVRDVFHHLAGLGGFLMRKRDGNPGWITLWRGLDKLILAVRGFVAMKQKCG